MYVPEHYGRLTDEMERRLLMEAIEEQMRPRPVRAIRAVLHKFLVKDCLLRLFDVTPLGASLVGPSNAR